MLKNVRNLVFDLDDTLYDRNLNIRKKFKLKVARYFKEEMNLGDEEISKLFDMASAENINFIEVARRLGIDVVSFFEYSCDIDVSEINVDEKLMEKISSLDYEKFVYTNSTVSHTQKTLKSLGLQDVFTEKFTIEDSGYVMKPEEKSFITFFEQKGINPQQSIMFEDSHKNLKTAKELGMITVLLHNEDVSYPYVDYVFKDIHQALLIFK